MAQSEDRDNILFFAELATAGYFLFDRKLSCMQNCGPLSDLARGLFTFRRPLGHIKDGESNGAVGFGIG